MNISMYVCVCVCVCYFPTYLHYSLSIYVTFFLSFMFVCDFIQEGFDLLDSCVYWILRSEKIEPPPTPQKIKKIKTTG